LILIRSESMQRSVQAKLQESLLQCLRDYERHAIPLLGMPSLPSGSQANQEDRGFQALRVLRKRLNTLLGAEEHTRNAYAAWHTLLSSQKGLPSSSILLKDAFSFQSPTQGPMYPDMGAHVAVPASSHAAADMSTSAGGYLDDCGTTVESSGMRSPAPASPWGVNKGLEAAAQLLSTLHQESQDDPLLMEEAPELDPRMCNPQFAQGSLHEHLDSCADAIRGQAGPSVFPLVGAGDFSKGSVQVDKSAPSSSTLPGMHEQQQQQQQQKQGKVSNIHHINEEQHQQQQQQQFLAIQTLLYQHLKLKHEPIEWVYDGLAPLMLQEVLHRRKGAPLALALIAACLCTRLGVPATIVRATPGSAKPQGPTTLSMPEDVPHDVAVRHVGRGAVSGVPTDAWLVAGLLQPPGHTDGSVFWRPSGVFLDVSCRGGAVLSAEQAQQRYGEDGIEQEGAVMPWHKGCVWRPEGVLAAGCSELARATMVAHQRRGESDLVVHWLYQLLALDPRASEWEQMQA